MANDLATLSAKLATQLRDTDHDAWNSTEKDDLVTWAVARLYPHLARRLDPTAYTITLVAGTYYYSAPAGAIEIENLELVGEDDTEYSFLDGAAWNIVGDEFGDLKVKISTRIVEGHAGGTLRVHGYGRYDTSTNLIPDDFVPLALAKARAEAYRRMGADRARFLQHQASEQGQTIDVSELLNLTAEAEIEVARLEQAHRTARFPRPGRRY